MLSYSTVGLVLIVQKINNIDTAEQILFSFISHMLAYIITKYVACITHNAI